MKTITPYLWFDHQAEEAANFYVSVFSSLPGSSGAGETRVVDVSRYGESGSEAADRPVGSVMTVTFRLGGQEFVGLNGGPEFTFSEAFSLMVPCETQEEVDELWSKLSEGGEEGPCGWLKDRYGVSWQITPTVLMEMMQDSDRQRAERVMKAMLQMKKIEIDGLRRAYENA
jgi:predicted 3-demethylubiquinone-9 3-methyltransferase (glyoxalase superfamily)